MERQGYFSKVSYLIDLIKSKNTGPAENLAQKLCVSRRTIFRYLEDLRDKGASVLFSKSENTYLFEEEFDFLEDFVKRFI